MRSMTENKYSIIITSCVDKKSANEISNLLIEERLAA